MTLRSSFLPLNEKLDVRPVTLSSGIAASWFATSSASPSARISCPGSPVRLVKGSTATLCMAAGAVRGRSSATPPATTRASAASPAANSRWRVRKRASLARGVSAPGERPERRGEAGGIGVSAGRVRGQRFRHRVAQRARQRTALRSVRRPGRLPARPHPGEQFMQHHAQRVDVAAQIDRFAAQQLRARIRRRQRAAPGVRE